MAGQPNGRSRQRLARAAYGCKRAPDGEPSITPDMRISRTGFVHTLKKTIEAGKVKHTPRSRLVCMGMHDGEGKQYKDKTSLTPAFMDIQAHIPYGIRMYVLLESQYAVCGGVV